MTQGTLRPTPGAVSVVVLSAGLSTPSSTRMLADMLSGAAEAAISAEGRPVAVRTFELRDHARDLTDLLLSRVASDRLSGLISAIAEADAVIAVTPIFNTGPSGLFKTLIDALDPAIWRGRPVLLGATAGTARHSLSLEYAIRPMFVYLAAQIVPTAVFAASGDFGAVSSTEAGEQPLAARARRAGAELAALLTSRAADRAREELAAEEATEDPGRDGEARDGTGSDGTGSDGTERSGDAGSADGLDAEFADFAPMDSLLPRR